MKARRIVLSVIVAALALASLTSASVGATSPGTAALFPVTVSEVGIPSGVGWQVSVPGLTAWAVAPASITIHEPTGSYTLQVITVSVSGVNTCPSFPVPLTVNGGGGIVDCGGRLQHYDRVFHSGY